MHTVDTYANDCNGQKYSAVYVGSLVCFEAQPVLHYDGQLVRNISFL